MTSTNQILESRNPSKVNPFDTVWMLNKIIQNLFVVGEVKENGKKN